MHIRGRTDRQIVEEQLHNIMSRYPISAEHLEEVFSLYQERWREYHNLGHIVELLNMLSKCDLKSFSWDERAALILMIVYHDAIYRLRRGEGWSEDQSAKLCEEHLLAAHWPMNIVDLSVCGIRATDGHTLDGVPMVWQRVVALFLDLDLMAGLGETYEELLVNTAKIECEYLPVYLPSEFRAGRKDFVKEFVERTVLFHTPHFASYEPIVKSNLRRYIAEH